LSDGFLIREISARYEVQVRNFEREQKNGLAVSAATFKINALTLTGKTVVIDGLTWVTTVNSVKEKIQEREGVPPDQQMLIWSMYFDIHPLFVVTDCLFF